MKTSCANSCCSLNMKQHHKSPINHALKIILPKERFYLHEFSKLSVWRNPSNIHYKSVPDTLFSYESLLQKGGLGMSIPQFFQFWHTLYSLPANFIKYSPTLIIILLLEVWFHSFWAAGCLMALFHSSLSSAICSLNLISAKSFCIHLYIFLCLSMVFLLPLIS